SASSASSTRNSSRSSDRPVRSPSRNNGSCSSACTAKGRRRPRGSSKFFQKKGLSVGLVAADVHRPAACDQLKQLAEQINASFYGDPAAKDATKIAKAGVKALEGIDVIVVDSSGRHALEPDLIQEIESVGKAVQADERLLVVDATVGQQAGAQGKACEGAGGMRGVSVAELDG